MPRKEALELEKLRRVVVDTDAEVGALRRQFLQQEQALLLRAARAYEGMNQIVAAFGRRTIKGFVPSRWDFDVTAKVFRKRGRS